MATNYFPVLITDRLILRKIRVEDVADIFLLRSNKEVNQYLERSPALTLEEAQVFIEKILKGIDNDEVMLWAITLKGKDQLIGTVLLWNIIKQERKAEIGYELNPLYQGKGVMQEALDIVIQYGLKSMELKIIEAYTHKYNQRSIKLLQRKGFTRDMEAESRVGNSELGEKIIFTLINSTQL